MKNSELIKNLSQYNGDAEVGYELKLLTYVHADASGDYIDLGWCGKRYSENNLTDTGIFVVTAEYEELVDDGERVGSKTGTEVVNVYSSRDKAEKFGKWLLKYEDESGKRYKSYKVENFLIY